MIPPQTSLRDRCRRSLDRSRLRREAAARGRRRRFRIRGSGASLAAVLLAAGALGAGAAVGQQGPGPAAAGLLGEGSRGPAVAAVQRALGLPADGVYGDATVARVRRFQRRHGLLVDGVVGAQTRSALGLSADRPSQPTGAGTATGSPSSGALQRIAQCESGGNPRAVGGGGQYRGKYQFSRETWASVGGSGDPAAASEAEQDRRAAILYARSGSSQWPSCG